jgi:hypothetical protein
MSTQVRNIVKKYKTSEQHRKFFILEIKQFVGYLIFSLIVYTIYTILLYGTKD